MENQTAENQAVEKSVPAVKLSYEDAWKLLTEYTKGAALRVHARQVQSCMAWFGERFGDDPEVWGVAGMLHDLDYEMYPDQHCAMSKRIMEERGVDPLYVHAMLCHEPKLTGEEPRTLLEKTLYTVDELSGLINAACLMYPSKSIFDANVRSIKKKFKNKKFAAKIDRGHISDGCERMGWNLSDVIDGCIRGMQANAEQCGLVGDHREGDRQE